MLNILERLLGADAPSAYSGNEPEPHHVAAAALLIEAASVDGDFDAEERDNIERLLIERFGLDPALAARLMDEAEEAAQESADWHGFTRVLKDAYDEAGRIAIIEMLWEVVESDGRLHDLEASLMRRVPALLYVSDRDNAEARRRAKERLAGRA
jgi:uncharacterized tellurite resistance protein B-like protein